MPMALQTPRNEGVKILKANGRPTIRHLYISTLKKLGFEEDKGHLREWMTVARDLSAWALKVEYKQDLPPGL
jgi:hypothetical protein